jgi:nitroreductase
MSSIDSALIDRIIETRYSCRAFLDQKPEHQTIHDILSVASRAPSGSNIQPWHVYVLEGASLKALEQKVTQAHDALSLDPSLARDFPKPYEYYPVKWKSPYIDRRRENGWGLYKLLGIERDQKDKMHQQHQKNFSFFGAPVGLIFTVDKDLEKGSLIDYGMFLQNIMIAANARGLATCPQAAWVSFSTLVMPHIGASDEEMLVCGMALGWPDDKALVNTFKTPRVNVEEFSTWLS